MQLFLMYSSQEAIFWKYIITWRYRDTPIGIFKNTKVPNSHWFNWRWRTRIKRRNKSDDIIPFKLSYIIVIFWRTWNWIVLERMNVLVNFIMLLNVTLLSYSSGKYLRKFCFGDLQHFLFWSNKHAEQYKPHCFISLQLSGFTIF